MLGVRWGAVATLSVAALAGVCACSGTPTAPATVAATEDETGSSTSSTSPTSSPTSLSASNAATPTPTPSCVDTLVARLTPEQRVGQLLVVGAQADRPPDQVVPVLRDQHVGGVALLGTWDGADAVRDAVDEWQRVGRSAAGGLGVVVAADQEGGQVQHLKGSGFTSSPSALAQGRLPSTAGRTAATVGGQLKAAGVSVALAPVADTVAVSFTSSNAAIGRNQREYGTTPEIVTRAVRAVVPALQGAGVSATLKHFPGLGRTTGNTDLTADGTTDDTTTADDAYLTPFREGIAAGADLVMVSSALYPKIDPANRAVFSPAVVSGLLRERFGFRGVVVSDDLGEARSVASVPVGERATRFVDAGGDLVLTDLPSTVPAMAAALRDKAEGEPAFAAKIDAAAHRVVDLKVRRGLAAC